MLSVSLKDALWIIILSHTMSCHRATYTSTLHIACLHRIYPIYVCFTTAMLVVHLALNGTSLRRRLSSSAAPCVPVDGNPGYFCATVLTMTVGRSRTTGPIVIRPPQYAPLS